MARPVIATTQSVLGYLQHQEFSFQPYALNTPTSWSSSQLPAGLSLNAGTGLITGAVTKPGVYNVALRASNAEGPSDPVIFAIGIEASVADPTANVIDLEVDLGTRAVTRLGAEADKPLYTGKLHDDLIFRVQFKRTGIPIAVTLSALQLAIKEFEPEGVLATSTAFLSLGAGVFLVYLQLTGDALAGALSNYEEDDGTFFRAFSELEWVATNSLGVGPASVRGSSQTFVGQIARDIVP